ncbi:MAG: hypothetical protein J2P24_12110 [Streptosporangiales bacterium]|nr:hypothetical protein [Streptosporangiales bacterium]MBO0889917.1 hypothetical protein [Acidothermales bacterium]
MTDVRVARFDAASSPPDALGEVAADVVCVFGAPRVVRWRSRTAAMARRGGLVYVAGQGTVLLSAHRMLVRACATSRAPSVTAAVFDVGSRRLAVGASLCGDVGAARRWLRVLGDAHDAPQLLTAGGWHASDGLDVRGLPDGAALVSL